MSTKGILLAMFFTLLGLAAGIVIGRQPMRHPAASNAAPQATAPKSNAAPNPKPPAMHKPAPKPTESALSTTVDPSKIMTLEEAAIAIQAALAESNRSARYGALQRIASPGQRHGNEWGHRAWNGLRHLDSRAQSQSAVSAARL